MEDRAAQMGTLVFWNVERGFGFIRPDGGRRADDVWVHGRCLADSARVVGARVRFVAACTDRGRHATWAALVDAAVPSRPGAHA